MGITSYDKEGIMARLELGPPAFKANACLLCLLTFHYAMRTNDHPQIPQFTNNPECIFFLKIEKSWSIQGVGQSDLYFLMSKAWV